MDLATPIAAVSAAPRRPSPTWNLILPGDEGQAASDRASQWNSSLRPFDAFDVYLVDQIAANSVRIERCQNHERTTRSRNARRASLRWQQDRRLAAEELGARLPKGPARVANRLRATRQGCEWLIARWEGLGRALEAKGDWDPSQKSMVLDLLGIAPDLREGPSPLDLDLEGRRALIRAEIALLRGEIEGSLAELDEDEREAAEMGFGPDHDGEIASVLRLERTCTRRLEWARDHLRSGRRGNHPDGPGSRDRFTYAPPSAAPPSPSAEEERYRAAVLAMAARKQAEAAPSPTVVPVAVPVEATPAPEPVEAPTVVRPEPMPVRPASPAARNPVDALRAAASTNRRERRAQAAIARRKA